MQFGLFYEHQMGRPWGEDGEHKLFKDALEQVELADKLGIEYVWEVEHHFLEEYSHSSAPEVFLAGCSQRTKNIRLCHGIVLMPPGYNHPAKVAERIATLDLISDGRVEWGTGESSSHLELGGFRVSREQKKEMWLEAVEETAKMMTADPYPGHQGKYFSMPHRNVVPKPLQKPHPPLWMACNGRDAVIHAARLGIGALTITFVEPGEAKQMVKDYYDTFKKECRPIGQAVNPNIAMVDYMMCHEDEKEAKARGDEGFLFFNYALSHYYMHGTHVPGQFDVWDDFKKNAPKEDEGPSRAVGNPDQVRKHMEMFEEAGADQVVFTLQAGRNRHEHICEALELFGEQVLPEFKERHDEHARRKAEELAPYIEKALKHKPPITELDPVPPVDSYGVIAKKMGQEEEVKAGSLGDKVQRSLNLERKAGDG
ncbi:MAG: LLM class flavin-dependent oxidoreductase [Dehalococcoidia bacterium]